MEQPTQSHLHIRTPLIFSDACTRALGRNVYLKLESLQPSASFKLRGIGNYCKEQKKLGAKEFICSSGGNAGLAASYAARQLNIPITVVVPMSTSKMMIEKIKEEQATIVQTGVDWQEADKHAKELCDTKNACYVPPFDHPYIWSENATMVHEIKETGLKPDAMVVSVGGGGLYCGVIEGMHQVGWDDVPVYAVETTGSASFAAAMKAKKVVEIDKIDTVAKSLGARAVAAQAVEYAMKHPTHSKIVSDKDTIKACHQFSLDHHMLVEPACAASLALCYDQDHDLKAHKNVVVIVCGGAAVTPDMLSKWREEFDVAE